MKDFGFFPDESDFVFVSYYSRDPEILRRTGEICKELHNLKVKLWYDRGISYGGDWQKTIVEHIGSSNAVIVFLSNELLSSSEGKGESGVILEYDIAVNQKKKKVIPIFINSINKDSINDAFGVFYSSVSRKQGIYITESCSAKEAAMIILRELQYFFDAPLAVSRNIKHKISVGQKSYSNAISDMMQWLINIKNKWGTYDLSETPQTANTCECLFAMNATGYNMLKPNIYKNALMFLVNNTTRTGLISKSQNCETTIHTAMLLLIGSLEKSNPSGVISDFSLFDIIAENLWANRNEKYGWGQYIQVSSDDECSTSNTYWALRALLSYLPEKRLEYLDFVTQYYEFENDGTFGFFVGGNPRLVTSAMFLELYYCLKEPEQQKIKQVFPLEKCLNFVFDRFINGNVQIETESFFGMSPPLLNFTGKQRAPWNHICVGFALSSLAKAYSASDLRNDDFGTLLSHVDSIIDEQTVKVGNNKKIYFPLGIEGSTQGNYIFPTAHFLIGISEIEKVLRNLT